MPLPTRNVAWPPPSLKPALDAMNIWDTWWGGDPDRLEALYGAGSGGFGPGPKPIQYSAGLVGRIARWWWGTPTAPGERRTKLHVPIAGDLCSGSADLLFSEPPKFTVEHEGTQKRLDQLTDEGMLAALQTAAEVGAALGGVYLRPVYDRAVADRPWLHATHADRAIPKFTWNRLSSVTFWKVVHEEDGQVWRHLECHERGVILHGLYQGTKGKLGHAVPLEDHPATEGYAPLVNDQGALETGFDGLDVSYIPNQNSRRWRCDQALADLGRSDLDGIEPLMDSLDETYASWMRDIRLGKGRIVVPNAYLQSNGPGRGASWNPDQEAFAGIDMLARGDSAQLTVAQFAIRVQEHRETAEDLINQILRSAGYSGQTFGLGGDAAVTATEVKSRERRSMTTRGKKILRWRPGLAHAIHALLAVDQHVFRSGVQPQPPTIEFEDSVQEDPLNLANTADVLRRAQAASTDTLVRMAHPEWNDTQVKEEVARIQQEAGTAVPDPMQLGDLP
ncbi:phage portal protein [Streptomyces sp. NPDC052013]|uniref:phage portal protein n=1 Tax=Streptomyces sp. NPDC052013 TaxID=3365679 RepID=UPI0037D778ED